MNVTMLAAYALAVAMIAASSAWLLERALTTLHLPVRWAWVGALGLSVWLPLTSLISGPPQGSPAGAAATAEVVAPIAEADIVDDTYGDSRQEMAPALELLAGWRTWIGRTVASGAALLSMIGLAPAWIAGAWGAFSVVVGMVLIASSLRLNRSARGWSDETLLGRYVKVSPRMGPATVGFLTPVIVIPRWARVLPPHELELVLRHEGEHARSRDTLLLSLGLVAVVAFPWNPLVWWQLRRLKDAVEVDCDRRVLRNGVAPARYGDLLVRLGSRGRLASLAVPTMAGSTSALERRLTAMKNMRRRISLPRALPAIAIALLLVGVACTSEPPMTANTDATSEPSETKTVAASEPQLEDVIAIRVDRNGTTYLNGEVHPLDRISDAVASLDPKTVVSIEAHTAVPYRVMAALQEQVRAADLLRVVFTTVESDAQRSASRDVTTLVDDGVAMVLPESRAQSTSEVEVNPRNLLFLEVRPTGFVATRRGDDSIIREMRPREVETLVRQELALNPDLIAVVQTHPDAEYRHMYDVLDALQRAEATRFTLQVAE